MPEPTTTVEKPTGTNAPEDPGMAAFLAEKNGNGGSAPAKTEPEVSTTEEPATAATTEPEAPVEEPAEPATPAKTEAVDDSAARKDQNRLGFQLRQIRAGDPFVAQAKKALTNDYVNAEGITDDQREIRQMKADRYIEKLEASRATLVSDNQQIAEEYPFFNPNDKENFNEPLYRRALERFGRDSLEMSEPDENGVPQIVGYKVRLLDYMREEADLYQAASKAGTGTKPTTKAPEKPAPKDKGATEAEMDAASEEVGGASTAKTEAQEEDDPMVKSFLAGFDSV